MWALSSVVPLGACYVYIRDVAYGVDMKRLQIMIDEDLDQALEQLASQSGRSKAALIREFVRERVQALSPLTADPLWGMAGVDDFDPVPVDDVVYR
jgi:predicted transcriptional regulator